MRRTILAVAFFGSIASSSSAATFIFHPQTENSWQIFHRDGIAYQGLSPIQGNRAAVVFDLTGIDPADITNITLAVVPVEYINGNYPLFAEAIGRSEGMPLDPFIWTPTSWSDQGVRTYASEASPCFTSPQTCPAVAVDGYSIGRSIGDFIPNRLDVTGAAAALGANPFLQLTLSGSLDSIALGETTPPASGTALGWSGLAANDPRLAAPILTVEVVPEPGTALLFGFGLAALAARPSRMTPLPIGQT